MKAALKVYAKYVAVNSRGEKSLLVECFNAIYGTMVAGLLYYRKFSSSLEKRGFVMNPYDPCVWNKTIKGKQITIRGSGTKNVIFSNGPNFISECSNLL